MGDEPDVKLVLPEAPPVRQPSAEEQRLLQQSIEAGGLQLKALEGGITESNRLNKIVERILGREPTKTESVESQVRQTLAEKTLSALTGEGVVSPGLEADLARETTQLHEYYAQALGPSYKTSQPFVVAEDLMSRRHNLLREQSRLDNLTRLETLGLGRTTLAENVKGRDINTYLGLSSNAYAPFSSTTELLRSRLQGLGMAREASLSEYNQALRYMQPIPYQPQTYLDTIGKSLGLVGGIALEKYLP